MPNYLFKVCLRIDVKLCSGDLKEEARGLRKTSEGVNESKINELNEEILSLRQSLSDASEELKYCKVRFC